MSRKTSIFLMSNFFLLLIILSSVSPSLGVPTEWNAGDIYIWGYHEKFSLKEFYAGDEINYIYDIFMDLKYNITGVDTVAEEYDYIYTSSSSTNTFSNIDYGVESLVSNFDLDSNCGANFAWNYATNESVLYAFDFIVPYYLLIEPDWATLNSEIADFLNASAVIDQYTEPYNATVFDVTFADVLGNASKFSIMGVRNNLDTAKTKLTSETTSWSFEFDFSNIIHNRVWNSTSARFDYYPYENFVYQFEFSYTDGGVLSKFFLNSEISISDEDGQRDIISLVEYDLGGVQSLTANFSPLLVLPSIFLVAIVVKIVCKKES